MRSLSRIPLHPVLFSLYPVLYLYSQNLVYVPFVDTIRSLLIALAMCTFFILSLAAILKNWLKAGLLTSLILILFFSFGHVANRGAQWTHMLNNEDPLTALTLIWGLAFLVVSFLILRLREAQTWTGLLNTIGLVLLLLTAIPIVSSRLADFRISREDLDRLAEQRGESEAEAELPELEEAWLPDIYYIVYDGYVRADKLAQHYDFKNEHFLNELQKRGFFVVNQARSNYMNTNYSLNTSLNLLYMHRFPASIFLDAKYSLRTNYVTEFLRQQGYEIIVFDSGSNDTNAQYADVFISPESPDARSGSGVNPFELLLARSTMGLLLLEREQPDLADAQASDVFAASVNQELDLRRERIEHAFAHLPDFAADAAPQFHFAHIYLPHIPFLYGEQGEPLRYHQDLNLYWYEVDPENYTELYTYQVQALNQMTLEMIDRVLMDATRPVVIILQSDHGDEIFLDYERPTGLGVDVRTAIFSAIYFSDQEYETLYPTLTPVNSFRLIFNHWFGTRYPILPDRVYTHEHPLSTPKNVIPQFVDACDLYIQCPDAPPRQN